jgi:hypothetical protein
MKVGDFVARQGIDNNTSYGIILEVHTRKRWRDSENELYRITVFQNDGKVLGWYLRHTELVSD